MLVYFIDGCAFGCGGDDEARIILSIRVRKHHAKRESKRVCIIISPFSLYEHLHI